MINLCYLIAVLLYLYFCTEDGEVKRFKKKYFKRRIILFVITLSIYLFMFNFFLYNGITDFVFYITILVFLLLIYGTIEFYILGLFKHNLRVIIFGILLLAAIIHFVATNYWNQSSSLPRTLSVSLAFLSFYLAFWDLSSIDNLNKKFVYGTRILVSLLLGYFILGSQIKALPFSGYMENINMINTDYLTFISVILFFLSSGLKDSLKSH
jgi:hypothetical protein